MESIYKLILDTKNRRLLYGLEKIELSPGEYYLLFVLSDNQFHTYSEFEKFFNSRSALSTQKHRLCKRILFLKIRTIVKSGYRLDNTLYIK